MIFSWPHIRLLWQLIRATVYLCSVRHEQYIIPQTFATQNWQDCNYLPNLKWLTDESHSLLKQAIINEIVHNEVVGHITTWFNHLNASLSNNTDAALLLSLIDLGLVFVLRYIISQNVTKCTDKILRFIFSSVIVLCIIWIFLSLFYF